MLLLHVGAPLNTGGLVGSQGGYICGVADKQLLKGCDAPWSPMTWISFTMCRTVPSSLDTRAPLVGEVCLRWQTVDGRQGTHQGAAMRSASSKKTRTAAKVEEVRVRTPPQPIGRAASSETVLLSQVANDREILMRLLGNQSWWTAVWYFSLATAAVIFTFICFVTCVDFNAVQATNMAQFHSFVFADCHKSCFTLRGNFRRMEAHSTCTSERKSGRLFIEMSLTFLMPLTISSSQRWSLSALQPWLVRAARESDCKVSDCDSHVKRIVTRSDGRVCFVYSFPFCDFLCTQFCCCALRGTKRS